MNKRTCLAFTIQIKTQNWDINTNNLFNQKGIWTQTGKSESGLALRGQLDNTEGSIEAYQLKLNAGSLHNQNGRLVTLNSAKQHWQFQGELNNQQGILGNNGALTLDANTINNQSGDIKSQSELSRDEISPVATIFVLLVSICVLFKRTSPCVAFSVNVDAAIWL